MITLTESELESINGGITADTCYAVGVGVGVGAVAILCAAPLAAVGAVAVGALGIAGCAQAIWSCF